MVTILAVLAATLWPLNPFPRNRVHWLTDANGIEFERPGLVISKVPLQAAQSNPQQSCTVELLLRPADTKSSSTILTFYNPSNPEQFLVRQWTDGLLVSHDVVEASGIRRRKLDVDHAFEAGKILLVTIVSGLNGTVVYTNGQGAHHFSRLTITQRELAGQIVLGTSPLYYEPWAGQLLGLAVYSNELTTEQVFEHYEGWSGSKVDPSHFSETLAFYSFNERAGRKIHNAVATGPDLEIATVFSVPHKAMLSSPRKEFQANWEYVKDILLNIAGFVPLGFVVCAYLMSTRSRGRSILYTVFAAATLSFMIEVLQAYIPRRVSGTTDIVTNTLGAALGAALARPTLVRRFFRN
ncbi:MAG TPA: VanZ family protein [Candidatus Eremiobacteraceae bacterium]|nr:VanZ family protein [Candidatus Eremiobacteraceae bacterium]